MRHDPNSQPHPGERPTPTISLQRSPHSETPAPRPPDDLPFDRFEDQDPERWDGLS